jgi:hypothetical protein
MQVKFRARRAPERSPPIVRALDHFPSALCRPLTLPLARVPPSPCGRGERVGVRGRRERLLRLGRRLAYAASRKVGKAAALAPSSMALRSLSTARPSI